jgi:hypothetical protein
MEELLISLLQNLKELRNIAEEDPDEYFVIEDQLQDIIAFIEEKIND